MFKEVYRWNVVDAVKNKKEVYAICRIGEEVSVEDAKDISLNKYADEKNVFYVEWVEEDE